MAKSNPLLDCLKMLKNEVPTDMKNASAEDLMGVLGKLKDYASNVSEEINNSSDEVKEKYKDGADSLVNMLNEGIENPGAKVDTSGVDEFIGKAKSSKIAKDLEKIEENKD